MKEKLLGKLRQTLSTINSQDFRNARHKKRIERQHAKVTIKLLKMGLGVEVMRLRFESNTQEKFVPRVVDKLPVSKSRVGFIFGSNHERTCVERALLGRTFVGTKNGDIVISEYFRPEGSQDDLLFQLAERHDGLMGVEGVVSRKIPRQEAIALLFTGSEPSERAQETILFKSSVAKQESMAR